MKAIDSLAHHRHMLRDLGYHTVYKGKWHLSEFPAEGTAKRWSPTASRSTGLGRCGRRPMDGALKDGKIADEAVDWLAKRAPKSPPPIPGS